MRSSQSVSRCFARARAHAHVPYTTLLQTIQFIDDDSHLGLAVAADASLLAPALVQGYAITNVSVNQVNRL